jgi:hypothetical protein
MKYIPSSSYGSPGAPSAIPQMVQRRRTFHVFGFIATSLLFLSLACSAGVFFYKQELEKQLVAAKEELGGKSTSENEKKITELEAFYHKLQTAELLIQNHRAPSKLFSELEKITKKSVQLTSLSYAYDPGFDIELEMTASTDELMSVLLQKKKLLEESMFSVVAVNSISTTLDTQDSENDVPNPVGEKKIGFAIKGLLKKDVVAYDGKSVTSGGAVPTQGATTTPIETITDTESNSGTTTNEIVE